MEKQKAILITFIRGYKKEDIYFITKMNDKEVREDIKLRIKQVLSDIFKNAKNVKSYAEMVKVIKERARENDMLMLYEEIAKKFQHSNVWDIASEVRINEIIGTDLWIEIDLKERVIRIKDVKDSFKDLMEDIAKKKVIIKKYTAREMKIKSDKIRKELVKRIVDNGFSKRYIELIKQKPFIYNGEQFIPIFDIVGGDSFDYMQRYISCNPKEEDFTFRGKAYNYNDFIKADEKINKNSKADVYLCFTDNKLYVPAKRTLFEFFDKRAFFKR